MDGFLLINKPAGPTSHDIIYELRRITGIKKIGHAGTLDPLASGLLLVGIGEATKLLRHYVGMDKEYNAVLRLGAVSDTYDKMGKISNFQFPISKQTSNSPSKEDMFWVDKKESITKLYIQKILESFIGKQKQIPPMYSAKKVKGKKLYELARQGKEIERNAQDIEIYDIKLISHYATRSAIQSNKIMPQPTATKLNTYTITISIRVSSGTYIRTLAHDIGAKLGCGAYLEELCRTSIGDFKLKDAISIIIRQSRANDSGNLTNEINNNTKKISNHYNNKISTLYSPCLKNSHIHNNIITPNNWTEYLIPIKTVVVSGTFDGIHNGHRNYFKQARKIGNKLIAIVARDTSVKKIKFHFPKFTEKERIKFVKQCKEIDSVLLGSKENQTEFAIAQNPDIIALGYDQKSFIKDLKIKTKKLNIKIIRLKPYKPKIYKSSIINNKKTSAGIYSSAQ